MNMNALNANAMNANARLGDKRDRERNILRTRPSVIITHNQNQGKILKLFNHE